MRKVVSISKGPWGEARCERPCDYCRNFVSDPGNVLSLNGTAGKLMLCDGASQGYRPLHFGEEDTLTSDEVAQSRVE